MKLTDRIKGIFQRTLSLTVLAGWPGFDGEWIVKERGLYANEVARACIRTLAEHTSKANVRVIRDNVEVDLKLRRMIEYRPNQYMNGKDFLYKVRTLLEINNIVFIEIFRDDAGRCVGLYPLNPARHYDYEFKNKSLIIKFYQLDGTNNRAIAWDDLAVLRKDYHDDDIFTEDNTAILTSLDLLNTTSEGMANAIKSTGNLRGILKSTKAMLKEEDAKKMKDNFVRDYASIENKSGIASIDATMDFTPIEIKPQLANYKNIEELRNNIYRYFGVSEDAIMSKLSGDKWEALYEARIEPFLLALSLELTYKIYSDREMSFGNEIIFESNRLQYATTKDKLALVAMVDRRAMTANEWRAIMNMSPVPGGDELQSWQNPRGDGNDEPAKEPEDGQTVPSDEPGSATD